MKNKTVLIGICASIAAYKTCEIINILRKDGINTIACMSRDADHFITQLTLKTLTGNRVYKDMFETKSEHDPLHICLAEQADLVLIVPATADVISKVACGLCDDLLSCTVASTKAKVLFAPAMNEVMYNNKIVQSNIGKLKEIGYHFIGPVKGHLACGVTGMGHLADTGDIIRQAKRLLKSKI